ncbi:hypothetical protein OPT61_g5996 [Boeremia exigua]|uniref:Uncharacterized protein n=1 Tax=Boeremia exigua TaxID=749465 RepID=A0ACC2I8C9_9PLEO|nr:hypothetical protein OPT61_g5996 [Boeremia exigua]
MEEDKKPERPTSAHSSDKERDSFEDASEITPRPESHSERSQSRSRSLISKRESTDTTVQEPKGESPAPEIPEVPSQANDEAQHTKGEVEATETSTEDAPPAKSPLLTAHRISVTSDMDDVSLEEGWCTKDSGSPPSLPPRDSRDSTASASGLQGLSGQMSPVKFPPPPPPPVVQEKPPPPAPVTRKLTSPFAWLSRNSSSKKPGSPPHTLTDRRNTNASIQSLGSNPELTLSRIDDEDDSKGNNRSSWDHYQRRNDR